MTTAEPAVRKPTAKELAEEALENYAQLRAELTEMRDQLREGGTVTITQDGAVTPAQLDDLENRTAEGFERLQVSIDRLKTKVGEVIDGPAVVAVDPEVIKAPLAQLEAKVAESFKAYSKIVDSHNEAATKAIEELREKMRLFDEAGVAPASAEDVDSLDNRLKGIEQGLTGTATSADLNDVHQRINELRGDLSKMRGYLESPAFAAIERAADRHEPGITGVPIGVPAVYGQVHQLMKVVTELGKDKTADKKMGGYAFRSIDAAMDAVGRALREVGVMFQPREILEKRIERYETVSKDGYRQNWTHVWVTQRYAFVSLIDGSEMDAIEMDGEARDNGDKSTSKADSMRYKYALLQALCIPVNGLPESDGSDGSEGGQVYGRGSAGDAFDNASPARRSDLTEQHVDSRPQVTPEEVENSDGTAFGYAHQPAGSPGGHAHAQAQQQPEEDDRTPEEKALAAYHALIALAGLEKPEQRRRLDRILRAMNQQGLADVEVTGVNGQVVVLGRYAAAVNAQVGAQ